MGLLILAIGMLFTFAGFFFSLLYDFPLRFTGHYEKGSVLSPSPFTLSPDGKTVVFTSPSTGHGDIYSMAMDGSHIQQLTSKPEYEANPCYSPDGRSILFTRETSNCGHIWIMNADGSNQRQLTFGLDYDESPIFTPNGDHILFRRTPWGKGFGQYLLFTMSAEGTEIQPSSALSAVSAEYAVISPKDGSVYYTIRNYGQGPYSQIWQMRPDGTNKHKIADGNLPSISPDNSQIAFLGGREDNELWVMRMDGSNQRQIYTSKSTKIFISCTPNGRGLLFLERLQNGKFISRIDINGSSYHEIYNIL